MKRIDAADLAEIVRSRLGMKLVLGERLRASEQLEAALVNLDHECILLSADRTVTSREFREVSFDLESDRSAVAAALVLLQWTTTHSVQAPELEA